MRLDSREVAKQLANNFDQLGQPVSLGSERWARSRSTRSEEMSRKETHQFTK